MSKQEGHAIAREGGATGAGKVSGVKGAESITNAMRANYDSNKIVKQPKIEHWRCAVCLYTAGLGCVRIGRLLRKNKGQVARWVRFAGVSDAARQNGIRGNNAMRLKWAQSADAIAKQAQQRLDDASMLNSRKKSGRKSVGDLPLFKEAAKRRNAIASKKRYEANGEAIWKRQYQRIKANPAARIRRTTRHRLWKVLKGNPKSARSFEIVGCTHHELKAHLEAKFLPGMTWDNYGVHGWHIDHIIPCAAFDLSKETEQRKCFHFTNLQPLWAKDNLRKSDSLENFNR